VSVLKEVMRQVLDKELTNSTYQVALDACYLHKFIRLCPFLSLPHSSMYSGVS
jgi:hypothetical protein